MSELDKLITERRQIIQMLWRNKKYFDNLPPESIDMRIIQELDFRVLKLEPLLTEFNEKQNEVEKCPEINLEEQEQERVSFESLYYSLIGDMKYCIANFISSAELQQVKSPDRTDMRQNGTAIEPQRAVQLPALKLPQFNGHYDGWLEFKDGFNALVHDNITLTKVQKFYYLKSCLRDEALNLIETIQVTEANYDTAWQLLYDRYENKALLIHNHIRALFDYPTIDTENHGSLRAFYDAITKNIRALEILGEPTASWDRILIYLLSQKMDKTTRREWELYDSKDDLPTMSDMNKFLKQRCDLLEKLEITNKSTSRSYEKKDNRAKGKLNAFTTIDKGGMCCYYCKDGHAIYQCDKFKNLTGDQRSMQVRKLSLCYNCLRPSHRVSECSHSGCKKCGKKHNTLLHSDKDNEERLKNKEERSNAQPVPQGSTSTTAMHTMERDNEYGIEKGLVLLSTAMVKVKDSKGNLLQCRALLDSGAQSNFITEKLCNRLNLKCNKINMCVVGIGKSSSKIQYQTNTEMTSCDGKYTTTLDCLVIPSITDNLPVKSFAKQRLNIPEGVTLADPQFNKSSSIDILIGSSVFWGLLCEGSLKIKDSMLSMRETYLGWVIAGGLHAGDSIDQSINCLSTEHRLQDIEQYLTRFWEMEELTKMKPVSQEELFCEKHFKENLQRTENDHFEVSIPFKPNIADLGETREMALQRFMKQEDRLLKNESMRSAYIEFMAEYEKMGHMTEVCATEEGDKAYYLPHHAVVREDSKTTRLRVVFDASMKSDTGLSLNDVQYVGPSIQDELLGIILRFRKHEYVMTADISKMYRMIYVTPEQRRFQRIFWRSDPKQEIKCYELNTVTYGTASASFLAVRCLVQVALDNAEAYPDASKSILNSFYMDDYLEGASSEQELLRLQADVTKILSEAGFQLRKWLCNKENLSEKFHCVKGLEANILSIGENELNKTLGILWNSRKDTIQILVSEMINNKPTKRTILATISQIFDPLGLIGPVIVIAKLIMQKLWQEKVGWDKELPSTLISIWTSFKKELSELNNFTIPRRVITSNACRIELHGFSDASEKAYGCCLYLRSKGTSGEYESKLLCSKSRVAPLKRVTLPRLELCAALLLARLANKVVDYMQVKFQKICYWSDSQITLAWIKGCSSRWKTFVANRTSEIQELTDKDNWHHIASADNPADLISRGCSAEVLQKSSLWWTGPEWLKTLDTDNLSTESIRLDILPEEKTIANILTLDNFELFERFSSLPRLTRVFAYCLRFIASTRNRKVSNLEFLTAAEVDDSLKKLTQLAQKQSYPEEYDSLCKNLPLSKGSSLLCLNPILQDEIIRVGGRLQNSGQDFDKKHPIILPKDHKLTRLIFRNEHKRLMHCGPTLLLSSLRERYWPIDGKNLAKKLVRECIMCYKVNPKQTTYIMGNLPKERVNQYLPFYNVGCDFAGPFFLKDRMTRGAKLVKGYVCIFICLATKAIHLEAVLDLTTNSFLACFKRFIGRRGKPASVFSDNGTNFIGGNSEQKKLFNFVREQFKTNEVNFYFTDQNINWHFIPARAPNFGGLWEAGVKSFKFHFKRVVGNANLNYDDFITILIQIESILNSRPICPLLSSPDSIPLTPAHFLLGRSLTALPEKSYLDIKENRLKRYERLQQILQHFWKRWHREYLCELQTRTKWRSHAAALLKVGSIVLLQEDNTPPLKWPLGRIEELHPGPDGVVRVVTVKVNNNSFKRAVTRVCLLPTDCNDL